MTDHAGSGSPPAALLQQHLPLLVEAAARGEVLDLACGGGQNGLLLAKHGASVVFADRNQAALGSCEKAAQQIAERIRLWQVDFEAADTTPLAGQQFAAILVFRYLHRPLIPAIRQALMPGGLLVYETFTIENRQFGRPNSKNFLLQPGELPEWFDDWEILHYRELVEQQPVGRAVAQLVARKPAD